MVGHIIMLGGDKVAYSNVDFKTKRELKDAIKAGRKIGIFNPSGMFPCKQDGIEYLEGPHYPKPHTWYASVVMKDGYIVSVK